MNSLTALAVLGVLSTAALVSADQDHHSTLDQRGAAVMGFDQQQTTHHFLLFQDGGAIDVSVKNPSDTANRDAIRSHLPHIAGLFSAGNFDAPMLVHESASVPGTSVMAARKDLVRYRYTATPRGGRIDITTTDAEALAAVHTFLKFQIADHKTGDPTTIKTR